MSTAASLTALGGALSLLPRRYLLAMGLLAGAELNSLLDRHRPPERSSTA